MNFSELQNFCQALNADAAPIVEQEEGRTIPSKETWSVIESGATLEKVRERPNGDKQTLIFRRMQ